mmetsp:Transcript_22421/g.33550  ORF Transcript_22421/g.33550 Transcript_22421/m.33550 type:complete len:184 (-) Transcript_22421:282-833(-)
MFIASAANDTLQGRAIHKINEQWGADFRCWNGRETIGISVCKKKYAPFNFRTETLENGQVKIHVTRMYGCVLHSHLREEAIRRAGPRKGWEPFGQWSIKKAEVAAKKVADKINTERRDDSGNGSSNESSSEDEGISAPINNWTSIGNWKQLCQNGKCTWKIRDKLDDICSEIQEAHQNKKVGS